MADVLIYATGSCPYCMRARQLFERKNVVFNEIRVDLEPAKWQEMEQRTQRDTVPQIFIGERHVGGFDDLVELELDDQLDPLLGLDK